MTVAWQPGLCPIRVFLTMLLVACAIVQCQSSADFTFRSRLKEYRIPESYARKIILSFAVQNVVPIIYVSFGMPPEYVLYCMEVAQRTNDLVILVSDAFPNYAQAPMHYYNTSSNKSSRDSIVRRSSSFEPSSDDISNSSVDPSLVSVQGQILYVPMNGFLKNVTDFEELYRPYGIQRLKYELFCIKRWFVVRNLAVEFGLPRVFYGDDDTVVLYNMTHASLARNECDAVLVVEGNLRSDTKRFYSYVNGGSSLWSALVLEDFCTFLLQLYSPNFINAVTLRGVKNPMKGVIRVVDMTLLWIYWLAKTGNVNVSSWDTGRPYFSAINVSAFDRAIARRALVKLPQTAHPYMKMCNGLDVVGRTTFDHLLAYKLDSFSYNLPRAQQMSTYNTTAASKSAVDQSRFKTTNISKSFIISSSSESSSNNSNSKVSQSRNETLTSMNGTKAGAIREKTMNNAVFEHHRHHHHRVDYMSTGTGLPYIVGISHPKGGRPESVDEVANAHLAQERLYFLTVHYQGYSKSRIPKDTCDNLSLTAAWNRPHARVGMIFDEHVEKGCAQIFEQRLWPSSHKVKQPKKQQELQQLEEGHNRWASKIAAAKKKQHLTY